MFAINAYDHNVKGFTSVHSIVAVACKVLDVDYMIKISNKVSRMNMAALLVAMNCNTKFSLQNNFLVEVLL